MVSLSHEIKKSLSTTCLFPRNPAGAKEPWSFLKSSLEFQLSYSGSFGMPEASDASLRESW